MFLEAVAIVAHHLATRHAYDTKSLADQFDAKPAEIRQLLPGGLDPARARELTDAMRPAGLPL